VSHPNIYTFLTLSHISKTPPLTAWLTHIESVVGWEIRRPKKKRNLQNDTRIKTMTCIDRYDNGAYSRL